MKESKSRCAEDKPVREREGEEAVVGIWAFAPEHLLLGQEARSQPWVGVVEERGDEGYLRGDCRGTLRITVGCVTPTNTEVAQDDGGT